MTAMTQAQMAEVSGGDFWSGLACGLGIALLVTAPVVGAAQVATILTVCLKTVVD